MRLIDADKLKENFETFYKTNVKDMSEEYSADIEPNIDYESGELLDNWVVDMQNDLTAEHIRIVSSGLFN